MSEQGARGKDAAQDPTCASGRPLSHPPPGSGPHRGLPGRNPTATGIVFNPHKGVRGRHRLCCTDEDSKAAHDCSIVVTR